MGSVGSTYQKVDEECVAIFEADCPSTCIQIITRMEVNGRATIRAPIDGLRFTISETQQ